MHAQGQVNEFDYHDEVVRAKRMIRRIPPIQLVSAPTAANMELRADMYRAVAGTSLEPYYWIAHNMFPPTWKFELTPDQDMKTLHAMVTTREDHGKVVMFDLFACASPKLAHQWLRDHRGMTYKNTMEPLYMSNQGHLAHEMMVIGAIHGREYLIFVTVVEREILAWKHLMPR